MSTSLGWETALVRLGAIERELAVLRRVDRRLAQLVALMSRSPGDDPAALHLRASGCGVGPDGGHVLSPTCAVGCLKGVLPTRSYNVIAYERDLLIVADVLDAVRSLELLKLRNVGEKSLGEVKAALSEAGLLGE